MSKTFIQVDRSAIRKAPQLARLLGIDAGAAFYGLALLWDAAFDGETVVKPIMLKAYFGCDGAQVAEALEAFGFVEAAEDGWRVKGTDRYERTSKRRSAAAKKAAAARWGKGDDASDANRMRPDADRMQTHPKRIKPHAEEASSEPPETPEIVTSRCDSDAIGCDSHALRMQNDAQRMRSDARVKREEISLTPLRGEGDKRARVKPASLPPAPAVSWPSPEHEQAAQRYLDALQRATGRPPQYRTSALAVLAERYGHAFIAAVAEAEQRDVGWQGWHVSQPRNWLETLCKRAAEPKRSPPPREKPKSRWQQLLESVPAYGSDEDEEPAPRATWPPPAYPAPDPGLVMAAPR